MTKKLTLFFASLLSAHSFAGQEVGNGGNVLICNKANPKIEMFDLAEAKDHFHYQTKITVKSLESLLKERVEQLRSVDPVLAERLAPEVAAYPSQFEFKPHVDLTQISDSLELSLPKGCTLTQIAIRKKTADKNEPRFLVSQDLWNQLDLRSKAALVYHELIYQDFLSFGAQDSRQVRKLNAILQSDEFRLFKSPQYRLLAAGIPELHTRFVENGVSFLSDRNHKLGFDDRGLIIRGTVATPKAVIKIHENEYAFSNPNGELVLEFYANGIPVSGWLADPTTITVNGKPLIIAYLVKFSSSGEITQASLVNREGQVLGTYPKKP